MVDNSNKKRNGRQKVQEMGDTLIWSYMETFCTLRFIKQFGTLIRLVTKTGFHLTAVTTSPFITAISN